MKLYNYSRSSASFRVRIAANLKGLPFDYASINLSKGESRKLAYETINPFGKVPALEDDGTLLTQSLAICGYPGETSIPAVAAARSAWTRAGSWPRVSGSLRDPSTKRWTRAELSRDGIQSERRSTSAMGPSLDWRGFRGDRKDAGRFCANRSFLSWRYAHARRRVPRPAGLQCAAGSRRHDPIPDDSTNLRRVPQE